MLRALIGATLIVGLAAPAVADQADTTVSSPPRPQRPTAAAPT